jgi:hypothetical protein
MSDKNKSKSIWWKLGNLPDWLMIGVLVLGYTIPSLYPLNLPVAIDPWVYEFDEFFRALPDRSVIMFENEVIPFNYGDMAPLVMATFRYLLQLPNNPRIIIYAGVSAAAPNWMRAFEQFEIEIPPDREYGRDYIYLGYPGRGEVGQRYVVEDLRGIFPTDWLYNEPIGDWPIMEGIYNATDYDVAICSNSWVHLYEWMVHQFYGRFGIMVVALPTGEGLTGEAAYYPATTPGFPWGARGGAQLEQLIGYKGLTHKLGDAFQVASIWVLILIVLSNVSDYMVKKEEAQ